MARNPIMALVMMCIPFVNIYLLYQWWSELKAAKKGDSDPIVWTILSCIPLVQFYAIYKFMLTVDEAAKKAGKEGYPLGVVVLLVISILIGLPFLYVIYKTQDMMNECKI